MEDPFDVLLEDEFTREALEAEYDEAFGHKLEREMRKRDVAEYLAGNGQAVVNLLELFIQQGHPDIPPEAQERLLVGLHKYQRGYQNSLDNALGVDTTDSARAARKRDAWTLLIYAGVTAHRRRGSSDPFADAGARWGISAAQAKQYYYAYKKQLETVDALINRYRLRDDDE